MPLAEYLASEQAREDVRRLIAGEKRVIASTADDVTLTKGGHAAWQVVECLGDDGEEESRAYYRPDGDRYVVTDLGEGVRALRLRTGCTHYEAMERSDPMREALRTSGIGNVWSAERGIMELDSITPFDLPGAICRVMAESLRVAQS